MLQKNIKIYIMLLLLSTLSLFADIDLQKSIYDSADEMVKFDEKMNRLIAEHNGVEYERESSNIIDFEERENYYLLERNIEENNNTQIELSLKDRVLSIEITVREQEEIKTETISSQETTMSQSTTSLYIPENADENTLEESYKNGILKVIFQKK